MKIKYSTIKKRKIVKGDWVCVLDNPHSGAARVNSIYKVHYIQKHREDTGDAVFPESGGGMYEKYLRLATEEEIRQKEEESKS